jgi:hypothetical protein
MHACQVILRDKTREATLRSIKSAVGNEVVGTLPEVGRAFGVAANTVKQSWKPSGMPGTHGDYRLADILIWRLQYEANIRPKARAAASKTVQRLNAIERRLDALEAK